MSVPSPSAGLGRRAAARLHAIVFAGAGLATVVVSVVPPQSAVHSVAAILGAMLTLAGLCFIAAGGMDERPLQGVPFAMPLLIVAAAASMLKTLLLQAGASLPHTVAVLVSSVVGVVGGLAVASAVVLLLRARSRHRLSATTMTGLSVIAVTALAMNTAQLLGVPDALPRWTTAVSGAALLLIALGLSLRPSGRPDA